MKVNGVLTEFTGDAVTTPERYSAESSRRVAERKLRKCDQDLRAVIDSIIGGKSPTISDVDNAPDISVVITGGLVPGRRFGELVRYGGRYYGSGSMVAL
jgi:hypothetical protein